MTSLEIVLKKYNILLGSKSPRRKKLLTEAGIKYKALPPVETDESYPDAISHEEVPVYLAIKKANAYKEYIRKNNLLITADTIVCLDQEILNKPASINDARHLLKKLSGNCHHVISGISLTSVEKQKTFFSVTKVFFKTLSDDEIEYYITNYKPFDKAGAYGIQEWIGYIGVERIEGSFYNVMGLPTQKLYTELLTFN